ncbi:transposase (fragment) [Candidatus Contendobacter odensis Run_B_J11]|uniref:Transposase n=1 Tax=Candidatus Contendobacter odensis Run_B_J11 TaxID=1400861 RepID=A0A7U7J4X0_9GAMM
MRAHDAQKNELKPWLRQQWGIPPQANAEFVCAMEDVLEVYTRPYDPARPVGWCADEAGPYQAIPQPGVSGQPMGQPARYPHEYLRGGTAK